MWHCVISGGVIACQSARNCFKYYNLWYAVRFAWCHWGKISKFNIFHFLPASAVSVSDNFSSPHGDSRWGRGKWLEVTVLHPYLAESLHMWHIYNTRGDNVLCIIFRMKGQSSRSHRLLEIFSLSAPWPPLYLTESLHMWHTYNTWGGDVSHNNFCHLFALWPHTYLNGLRQLRGAAAIRSLDHLLI